MVLEDESGFSLVSPLKRTWAPRGQTPVIRTSLTHSERLNVIGALLLSPGGRKLKLSIQTHTKNLSGDEIIAFLKHLLQLIRGSIVLVWDNHPIHQRKKVQVFLARHSRIHVHNFPTCAPELNPAEGIWNQTSEYIASTAPHDRRELRTNVLAGINRTRHSRKRLWACIYASDLPWGC